MAINTRNDFFTNRAKGLGYSFPIVGTSAGGTAAAAASGFETIVIAFNTIGTTLPTTLVGYPVPAGLSPSLFSAYTHLINSANVTRSHVLAYFYKLGTLDLANAAATPYDGFTHNANFTGPITRSYCGGTSMNIQLMPLIHLTVATTVTAPAFILQATAGPGNGYKNQAGNNVIGTKTFTMPAAATLISSCFFLRLEDGDSAVTDMTQISVTTKGSAGTANIWGLEVLSASLNPPGIGAIDDGVFGGLNLNNMAGPGTPTTGTITAGTDVFLGHFIVGSNSAIIPLAAFNGVLNT